MKIRNGVVVFLGVLALTGCNSTRDVMQKYEKQLSLGQYQESADDMLKLAKKEDKDELIWRLMAGKSLSLAGKGNEAIVQFDRAEDIFARNDSQSVFSAATDDVKAMLGNDRFYAYNGTGQDRIFCCLYKALEYGIQGNRNAARTEFNRAYEHQENWLFERRRDIDAANKALEENAQKAAKENKVDDVSRQDPNTIMLDSAIAQPLKEKCDFDVRTSGNLQTMPESAYCNAYLSHVCGIFRWLNGDSGRDFLRDASRMKPSSRVAKEDFQASSGGKPVEQVWVYIEDGLCPIREEFRIDLPLALIPGVNQYVQYVGMAFPYLRYRGAGAQVYQLKVGNQQHSLELFEDIDHLIKTEYDVYMRGAIFREISRCLLKVGIQVGLGIAADNSSGWTRTVLYISQWSTAGWMAVSTSADLRSWTGLPKRVYLLRIQRPADGRMVLKADNTYAVNLDIPQGNTIVWAQKPTPSSPFAVKMVTFK